ncbi:hypothetical protein KUW00_15650 [Halomonas sp. DP5N14-9]|uniref:hypothetical protein n=1 Tax=Halomonas sp. DP5N14-9 TaxID=2859075 RepID=UPI001C98EDB1|nr:hypothetical protein [Halomonas sp. DP5N14-9]MBY5942314.1 hypothetical protein [Halomonas sp. DP5N14-9]
MTTIAYKNRQVACDSRMTSDGAIISDQYRKWVVRDDGVTFWLSGDASAHRRLMEAWPNGEIGSNHKGVNALAWDGTELFAVYVDEEGRISNCPHDLSEPMALGSGADHAITAMDMGADPRTAVAMAARRDCATGGIIRVSQL